MFRLVSGPWWSGSGWRRRELLRVGALGMITLPDLLRLQAANATPPSRVGERDISCIFLFLWGGPSQHETFDPKPESPAEVRGPFNAIETSVPGIRICEHLPRLAKQADRYALIRCMHHENAVHPQAATYALTGSFSPTTEHPNHGSTVARFTRQDGAVPTFVRVGRDLYDSAGKVTGQNGGFLGSGVSPFLVEDPTQPVDKIASLALPQNISMGRMERRRSLYAALDRLSEEMESEGTTGKDAAYRKAFDLVLSPEAKKAFDITQEPKAVRDRYGYDRVKSCETTFGQCCLAARRLIEAGARFVQVNWSNQSNQHGWDYHSNGTGGVMKDYGRWHLPILDQALSALLQDLDERGLLEKTLVVAVGEFGRTPKMNGDGGRDHWPNVYSALIAGAGIPGGRVIGQSDRLGGEPEGPVCRPEDMTMSIYRLLGLDVALTLRDARIVGDAPGIPNLLDG
jgi:uncharacterized protein DUF1501